MKKFRVWCKNNNEWEKDDMLIAQNGDLFQQMNNSYIKLVNPKTHAVEFSTEIEDINKTEIHVGDILCITSRHYSNFGKTETDNFLQTIYTVIWLDDGFGLKRHDTKDFKFKPSKGIWYLTELKETKIEVIGNIHNNSELLEVI